MYIFPSIYYSGQTLGAKLFPLLFTVFDDEWVPLNDVRVPMMTLVITWLLDSVAWIGKRQRH